MEQQQDVIIPGRPITRGIGRLFWLGCKCLMALAVTAGILIILGLHGVYAGDGNAVAGVAVIVCAAVAGYLSLFLFGLVVLMAITATLGL